MNSETKYPSQKAPKFNVRFPPGMRDKVNLLAKKYRRSVNDEILFRLRCVLIREGLVDEVRDERPVYVADQDDAELYRFIKSLSPTKRRALLELLSDD